MVPENTRTRRRAEVALCVYALYRPVLAGIVGIVTIGLSVTGHITDGAQSSGLLVQRFGPVGAEIGGVVLGVLTIFLAVLWGISRVRRLRACRTY